MLQYLVIMKYHNILVNIYISESDEKIEKLVSTQHLHPSQVPKLELEHTQDKNGSNGPTFL